MNNRRINITNSILRTDAWIIRLQYLSILRVESIGNTSVQVTDSKVSDSVRSDSSREARHMTKLISDANWRNNKAGVSFGNTFISLEPCKRKCVETVTQLSTMCVYMCVLRMISPSSYLAVDKSSPEAQRNLSLRATQLMRVRMLTQVC